VEKHMPPRITKSDLLKVISEAEPSVAPAEPGTKPDVKPPKTNPTKRPGHPGKNPDPGIKIKPKAGGSTKKSSSKEEEIVVPDKPTKPVSPDRPGEPSKPLRPAHPGRNPNPNVNPAPKAGKISPETAKDKVIDVILNILKK
jgi:hypothetical protein